MDTKRRIAILIAGALVVAGLGVWMVGRFVDKHGADEADEAVSREADSLGASLKSTAEAAKLRAEALAALPVVRASIETDIATVRDIDRSNNVFAPAPGEAIELFQLGERPVSLLRAPEAAHPVKFDGPEVQLSDDGEAVAITVSARVMPMYEAGKAGAVAVRRAVALDGARQRLSMQGLTAALTGMEAPLMLSGDGATRPVWGIVAKVPNTASLVIQAVRQPSSQLPLVVGIVLVIMGIGAGVAGMLLPDTAARERERDLFKTPIIPSAPLPVANLEPVLDPMRLAAHLDEPDPLPQLVPDDCAALPMRNELQVPDALAGRYRVISTLGAGHEAEVYLAQTVQQIGVPKVVALKLLREVPEGFLEWMRPAARLMSLNIARVHDCGITDGQAWVALEYVEGCTAACLIKELRATQEAIPLKQSLAIAVGICKGLESAHGARAGGQPAPVFHGDLRPSSVLIGRHGAVKVSDFGARPRLTAFTAPELARGGEIDARTDLYSVGMILNELTAGLTLPRSLQAVIAKATHENPRRRYDSAERLRDDLLDVAEAVQEPPSSGVLGDWVERVRRSHA
jgi:hypothetical protein